MVNVRTRPHISRSFLWQTERNWINEWSKLLICGGLIYLEQGPTCIDLSYQRFAPFFSWPPPCSISRALLVSLGTRLLGSSRHTTHTQLSIRARESLLVWSGWKKEAVWSMFWIILLKMVYGWSRLLKMIINDMFGLRPFVSTSLACAHSVLPSDVRMPKGGSLSSAFSAIFMIFSSWVKISISLSCLLFATTSNTKN